jgi:hypothetical protein
VCDFFVILFSHGKNRHKEELHHHIIERKMSSYSEIDEREKTTFQKITSSNVWRNVAYAGIGIVIVAIIAAIVLILVLSMYDK